MAGDSVIGALRIVLGADIGTLDDGLKGASAKLDDFAKQAKIAGAAIGTAIGGAIVGLGVSIKSAINEADKLGKLSESVGVPVEQLSQLKLAADLSGVSIETLGGDFSKLEKNMASAAVNATGPAARAFQAIGLSVRDASGNLKSGQQALIDIAGKFAGYKDGAEKSALATALFGQAGSKLIPMLNQGSDGLKNFIDLANQLGLTIDGKTKNAASAFNDNMTLMGKIWDGIIIKVTAGLLPAFQQLSGALLEVGKNGSLTKIAVDKITDAIQGAVTIAYTGYTVFERLGAEFISFIELMKSDNLADTKRLWGVFIEEGNKTQEALAQIGPKIKQFWADAEAAASKAAITVTKSAAPLTASAKNIEAAVDSFLSSQAKRAAQMQAEAEGLRMTTAEAQAYRMEQQAITIATEKNIPLTDALMDKIFSAATAYGQTAEQVERVKERFNQLKQTGEQVGAAIGSVFQNWISHGGKFGDVLKSLAGKLADIAFQFAITKPLQNIFGSMFSGAPLKLFGFASGGSFQVGGSGGIDSQLVAFKASPNEQVSVTKPGQSMGGGGSYVYSPQYHFSPGMTPADMASIRAQMAMADRATEERTIGRIRRAHQTDSGFLNG